MYGALLPSRTATDYDISALRVCISGGAALPVEVLRGFEDAFGCTGAGGIRAVGDLAGRLVQPPGPRAQARLDRHAHRGRARCASWTTSDHEVAQGQVGEIAIRGHNMMKGYWQRPEATAEAIPDGWFHTGDLARVDEDGYFYIVDRKKDLIIRGGYNVYPREIEEVLYEHPAVAEAAVIGLPACAARRGGRRRGGPQAGRDGHRRRAARLRQGPGRGLQVPAARVVRRRAAQGPDRQDPQAGHRRAGRAEPAMTPGTPTVTRRVSANGSATTEPQQRSTPVDQPNLSQPVLRGRDGAEDIADRAAPFDALLVQAARSPLRRFLPNVFDREVRRRPGPPPLGAPAGGSPTWSAN